MTMLFAIHASKSDGTVYRLLFGWEIRSLASWITGFAGLL